MVHKNLIQNHFQHSLSISIMASSSSYSPIPNNNKNKNKNKSPGYETDSQQENIIHVYADPSNFRDVVQKLTGVVPTAQKKLPLAISPYPSNAKHNPVEFDPVIPSFMLQHHRPNARNLQLQLNQNGLTHGGSVFAPRVINASPVSTFSMFLERGSPRTPVWPFVQEEIPMANIGIYSHSSPQATSSKVEPQLLPLFPTTPNLK